MEKLYKNEIVKVHSSILSNKQVEVQKKIATALSIEDSKEQSNKLKSLKLNKDSKYDTFNPLTSNYQKGVMQAGAAGKVGIGAYSNDVVFHSLVRQNRTKDKRISLADPITFGNLTSYGLLGEDYVLVENKKDAYLEIIAGMDESDNPLINNAREYLESPNEENVALGINFIEQTLFNEFSDDVQKRINIIKTPRKIADVLAERQNIATDNAKELIMEEAGLNSETLDVDKVMILLGFDKDASGNSLPFFFLNQPIVKDFIKELKNLDSVISEFIPDKQQHVYDLLKAKYKFEEKPGKIEALKNSQSKLMTGKNLEKQIKLFHTNGSVNENDFAFQQAVLEKFLDLRKTGKILRETQQNFNVDSQGIGKSTFDLYERIDRLKMLMGNKEVENIESLIGEFSESPKEGFIRLEADFYIKPTTALGHVTVNTLSTGLAVSEKHMPYNNVLFDNIFREIAAIKGGEMSPSAVKEMKQTVLQEMKKYINSSNFEFYDFNSRAERKYLFIDGKEANEKSLASYLQKSLLDPTGDNFAFLNSIPLFKQVDFEINKDGTPSKIKFNNTVDNIDENSLYTSIFKLMEKEIPLPSFNDREYNSRMLAQDLINYALLEGGVQEVTQISKFIPAAVLENTKYSEIVNLINDGLISGDANLNIAKWFGIPKSTKKESSPYDISKFTMQYVQHNPGIVSLVDLKESNPELTNITVDKETKEILSFTYASEKQMPAFLKAYNSKANKNSDLYYTKDGENYYKIDTLGTSGMNEYNSETNRNVQDSILPKTSEISNADRFTVESQNDVFNEGKTPETGNESSERPFSLDKKDMVLSLKAIALDENIDPSLKFLAETLLPIAELDKNQVELIIMSLEDFENGAYYPEENQLVIDSSFANSNKRNEIAEVLLHEYMHKLTVKELGNHVEIIGTTQPDIKINLKAGAPKHVENLVRLFNNFVKEAEKGIVIKKGKNKTKTVTLAQVKNKIRNGETLNSDERLLYPAIDIFEFMTGCTTNKDFQKLLYNTQYKGTGDSMFKKFKDIVKDFIQNVNLSLGLTKINDNNLSEALDNIFELIELPSKKKGTDIDESFFAGEKLKNDIDDALKKLEKAPGSVQNTQDDFENKELKFSYKSIHGDKTISIDTEFPLGAQQQKALENMIDWAIGGNDITYTLEGYAGTGKTSIIGLVEKYLKEYSSANGFAYMAPTHSATVSLGLNTSKYGNTTLPATFQSSVYQNARTGKHVFSMKMKERLESFYYPFVVVDEASMLSDAEVKQIIEAGKNANAKIIFVGDPKQVAAVDTRKGITQKSYSSAFSLPMKSILDKVYRTGEQKLLDILTKIRNNVNLKLYKSDQNTNELKFLDFSQYNRELEKDLKENPEDVSVIVYTNNEVISQNKRIRQVLNLKGSPKIGEKIMGYSGSENKKVEQGHLANSVPYTIEEINVLDTGEVRIRATGKSLEQLREGGVTGIPTSVTFDYLQLSTNDSFEFNLSEEQMAKNNVKISNIFKEVQAEYIKFKKNRSYYPTYIQNIREIKRSLAKYNLGNNYVYNPVTQKMELYSYGQHSRIPSVFQLKKGVDFGYAMTIHKSQGMTIPKVYFDPQTLEKVSNIDIVDDKGKATTTEKNSLYYVAMSRSSDKLVVMDSGGEEVIGKVAVDLDTVKEEFAKEQGFEDWKHVVRSINKRARERGKSEIPVSIEEFNNLTEKQISTFAKASKSAQQSKQPTTQPQGKTTVTKLPSGYKPVGLQNTSDEKVTITNADALNEVLISKDGNSIFTAMGRTFVLANVNGVVIPYYISSSGTSGKIKGAWYPFFGYTGSWLVKGSINKKTGAMSYSPSIDRVNKLLNDNLKFKNPNFIDQKGTLNKINKTKNNDGTISEKIIPVGNTSDYGLNMYSVYDRFPKIDASSLTKGKIFDKRINKPVQVNSFFVEELTGLYPINVFNDGKGSSTKWIKDIIEKVESTNQPQETYKGLPVVDTENIISFEGAKGAAQYDRENNIVKVNRKFLQQKYKEKAWTKMRDLVEKIHGVEVKSKAQNLPANQFSTYKEFENFVIEHEYQHSLYSRQDFDKEFSGKTKGDYESEINRRALEELKLTKPVQPVVKPEEKKQPKSIDLGGGMMFTPIDGTPNISDIIDKDADGGDISDIIKLGFPKVDNKTKEVERMFKLRNTDGSRKRFFKKNYTKVLEKTKFLNKNNRNTSYKFKIIEIMGEKGDRRTYYAIAVMPRNNVNFDNASKLDDLINDFEKTCK